MSVINNVLKDLENRESRFSPIDIDSLASSSATRGDLKKPALALLVIGLLAAAGWIYLQPRPGADLAAPVTPEPQESAAVISTEQAAATTAPVAAAAPSAETASVAAEQTTGNQIVGLQIRESEQDMRFEFVLRARTAAYLKQRSENSFAYHLGEIESLIVTPEISDNRWITDLAITPVEQGVDIRFETAADLNELLQTEMTDAPVAKLLQSIFEDAVQVGASDIHVEPDQHVIRIRQRIDGVLQEQVMQETQIAPAVVVRLKLMCGLNISEKRLPQDGRFHILVNNRDIDVRLSTMPVQYGESVVMRLLDQTKGALDLEQLGMPADLLHRFRKNFHLPNGMILVTGPTGSGKTTTLYAALSELNVQASKIVTVEDPVEYRLDRISQVQVNPRIGLTFAGVLRSALRQDPDIIMVSEMRDAETVEIGVSAAMTGHLVLSTLHTNDTISTATRLMDMGVQGYLLASTLRTIIAQRLVRKICQSCGEDYTPTEFEAGWLRDDLSVDPGSCRYRKGRGCKQCGETGYQGRMGVYELLDINAELAEKLRHDDSQGFVEAAARAPGYQPLVMVAHQHAAKGLTTIEEMLRLAGEVPDDVLDHPPLLEIDD